MWALTDSTSVVRVFRQPEPFTLDGIQHSHQIFLSYSTARLLALGIKPILSEPIPVGKYIVDSIFTIDGDLVRETYNLADVPPPTSEMINAPILEELERLERKLRRRTRRLLKKIGELVLPTDDLDLVAFLDTNAEINQKESELVP